MDETITELEDLKARLRLFLPDFLMKDCGRGDVSNKKKFFCINPKHDDKNNPNCCIMNPENPTHFHCFACGMHGDIFTAAHFCAKKPMDGKGFVLENVYWLAEKYGLKYSRNVELTDEDVRRMELRNLHDEAYKILMAAGDFRLAARRGWSEKTCKELGIGSVHSNEMQQKIFESTRVPSSKTHLITENLFGRDRLTFTIKDEYGHAIAFAARDTRWHPPLVNDSGKDIICQFPKYTNSCGEAYDKSASLYNIDVAKRHSELPLYIFEGYADVVTCYEHGIQNTVALGSTTLTVPQIKLIERFGFKIIKICLDGDAAGIRGVISNYKKALQCPNELIVQIVSIPPQEAKEDSDPDGFIKKHGPQAFLELPSKDFFTWMLENLDSRLSPEEICEEMMPYITRDHRPTRWNKFVNLLSDKTGIRPELILRQIQDQIDDIQSNIVTQKRGIVQTAYKDIMQQKEDPKTILVSAIRQLDEVEKHKKESATSIMVHLEETKDIFKTWEDKDPSRPLSGWSMGFRTFDSVLDGFPKRYCFAGIAALPSMGKTTWLANLTWNILIQESLNKDLSLVFVTIDDSREQLLPRLIGIGTGIDSKHVTFPRLYISDEAKIAEIKRVEALILKWIGEGRLLILDQHHGTMYTQIIENIRVIRERNRSRNVLVILDNFYKLSDRIGTDERTKFKTLSARLKDDTVTEEFSLLCTLELNKVSHGIRPCIRDISETGQIEYDANAIMLGYNEVHDRRGEAQLYWYDERHPEEQMPIFEVDVAKNKITGEETIVYFKMDPRCGRMEEITLAEAQASASRYNEAHGRSRSQSLR